jgi:hypothetical protein
VSSPGAAHNSLQTTARPTHSSEPILVPKLRINFADFPYLHYSNNQRLFTLETCCGYGYGSARKSHIPPSHFQGPTIAHWTPQEPRSFTITTSLSPGKLFSGSRVSYKERTTLPRAIADVCEFVCVTALASEKALSVSEFGNINPIPFRIICVISQVIITPFKTDFSDSLGPTDPCSTAVHMEPFSTLVLKGLT